jgi:hypothetical protein
MLGAFRIGTTGTTPSGVAAAVVAGRVSQLILPPAPSRIFCCDRSFHTRSGRYRVAYQ